MKSKFVTALAALLLLGNLNLLFISCNNDNELDIQPVNLGVSVPLLTLMHDKYYSIDDNASSVELVFSEILILESVVGNIVISDKNGALENNYKLSADGKVVQVIFNGDFQLKSGWRYELKILEGLRSKSGLHCKKDEVLEFRTTSVEISESLSDTAERTLIAAISDIHCGDERAVAGNYAWFGKNADALTDFLSFVKDHPQIKELVILGDLFDEWMVPYEFTPFDSSLNINNSKDYFNAIANTDVNRPVFEKLREIASAGLIEVIYVPGNHDMLITEDVISEVIPGAKWKSNVTGLGEYKPVDEIVMEHGHRYDFFNCPQPLVNEGHILPPGYFITRLYAAGLANRDTNSMTISNNAEGDFEFLTGWSVATGYTIATFNMDLDTLPMTHNGIIMSGIDGYNSMFSFNGARDMYAENIEEQWPNTQSVNNVPRPMSVFYAILNGTFLYGSSIYEYLSNYSDPDQPKVVAFGHSHEPEIRVFPFESAYTGIYANSGSWIDPDQSKYDTRTYLIINPADWSGSELDVVSLYQYNPDVENPGSYKSKLLKEKSIIAN